ncbi:hypothetical protein BDV25DRAFT_171872 [Aspergillus avenaceus]|uniref:Serine hydrolase domain-containing protein n=1 Tax=Aspergillus avenaceus TaxID=36643 RepID=A0A5N6TWR9_ASPAV|nr:hypothetical protein BDV25DRAFT_171872 [Aspergillus avenaceus]
MRLLCLHGHGTNSEILETQLAQLRGYLPADWEFDFLDGEMESKPATGIEDIFPGPYYSYHGVPIPEDVWRAYNFIMDVVQEEGPFDGVIGFSQGAQMAATIIAHEAMINPQADVFKFAVFLSAIMPFDMEAGSLKLTYDDDVDTLEAEYQGATNSQGSMTHNHLNWLNDCRATSVIAEWQGRRSRLPGLGRQSTDILLRYHPSIHGIQINIPTVHVYGLEDQYLHHARGLAGICDPKVSQVVTHEGTHQIPRDGRNLMRIAEAIQWAVDHSLFLN